MTNFIYSKVASLKKGVLTVLLIWSATTCQTFAQLTGIKNIPGDYATITLAISNLNAQGVGAGGVTFNIAAGYAETLTTRLDLIATGTASNPIVFQKSGAGANPLLTAYTGTALAGAAAPDGMWSLTGSDYVTINGIDLTDPNTASATTMMEYGYGLFKTSGTDGANNNVIKNCVITLNRNNTTTGGAPYFHGSTGIVVAACSPTSGTAVTTVTTVSGASSSNSFYTNTIQNVNTGISMIGYAGASPFTLCDFNNDIGGTTASTGNSIINFGGGTSPANACAATYISNQWSSNVSYNTVNNNNGSGINHAATNRGIFAFNSSIGASANMNNNTVTIQGGSSTSAIDWGIDCEMAQSGASGNTININNNTISMTKSVASTVAFTAIWINSAATTVNVSGNTISNFTYAGTGVSEAILSQLAGIGTLNITNNNINSASLSGATGSHYPIGITATVVTALNVTGNNINGVTLNAVTSKVFRAIYISTAVSTCANVVSANTFQNIAFSGGTPTGEFTFIYAGGSPASWIINNNALTGSLTNPSTGSMYFIYNSQSTSLGTVNGNTLTGTGVTRSGASGGTYGYYNASSPTGTFTFSNNTYSNISQPGTGLFYGIYLLTSTSCRQLVQNNTYSNISIGTGTLYGINHLYGNTNSEISGNTVTNLSGAGTVSGINIGATASVSLLVFNNNVNTISTSGASTVSGISHVAGTLTSIYKNKIYGIQANNASGIAYGLNITVGTSVTVYNNLIGNITAPITTSTSDAVRGISITSTTTSSSVNVYYNTVYLNAGSTAGNFNTSGIYHTASTTSTTATLSLRNNIIINTSTPFGTGTTVAYRRSAGAAGNLANYASTSDNNIFYAGIPGTANLIYSDGTSSAQTVADYKSGVFTAGTIAPRDANSQSENTAFTSTTGSSANFLHVNANVSSLANNGAVNISGITSDYDADIRQGNTGYTGGGTAPDIGADEYEYIAPVGVDLGAVALIAPATTGCYTGVQSVVIQVRNYGNAIDFSLTPATVTCNITGTTTATLSANLTGTLAANATVNVTLTGTFNMSVNGGYTFNAFTSCSSDATTSNDAMPAATITRIAPNGGTLTLTSGQTNNCLNATPTLTLSGNAGGSVQWQTSTVSNSGPWTNVSGISTYSPGTINQTTYFQVEVSCLASTAQSNVVTVMVNNPSVTSVVNDTRCGTGTVNISATPSSGAIINWYANATGGTPLATGNTFTTPVISSSTNFWAAASSGGSSGLTIPGDGGWNHFTTTGSFQTTTITSAYMILTVLQPLTLTSMDIYPSATLGSAFSIEARTGSASGTTFATWSGTTTVVNTTTPTVAQTIPVNWTLPAGTYYIGFPTNPNTWRSGSVTHTFPWTLAGYASMDFYLTPSYQYYFYNLKLATGCESSRSQVTATVTTAPAINATSNQNTICSGGSVNLIASSSNPNYSYTWTSTPSGFNATGANVTANSTIDITYNVSGNDAGTGCQSLSSVSITVLPPAPVVSGSPSSICASSGSSILSLAPATGYGSGTIQWETSPTGSGYTAIGGANGVTYTTPTISSTTFYRAVIKDDLGNTCSSPSTSIVVGVPTVNSTIPNTRCGIGTTTLQATGSSGSTIKWYANGTGGFAIGTGSPFTTPVITNTTTYYAAAETGNGSPVSAVVGAGATTSATYSNPFYSLWSNTHNQHLILASELYAAGMSAGVITAGGINITSPGTLPMIDFSIKIGNTTATSMASYVSTAFTTVYAAASVMPVTGVNAITFTTPFIWDGVSNIVIEICHGNPSSTTTMSRTCTMDNTSYISSIHTHKTTSTGGSSQCTDNATNVTTYTARPQFYFTFLPACSSTRIPVVATVTAAPSISVTSNTAAICPGGTADLSVSSSNDPSYTYSWTSSPSGFTASGNGPHTVGPNTTTKYYVSAVDNTAGSNAGCAALDSVTVVNGGVLVAGTVSSITTELCVSGSVSLTLTGASGGFNQWQSSTISNSGPWTNVGTGANTYSTGTITQTTYYRVVTACNTSAVNSNVLTITVNNPQLLTTTPNSRCGYGTTTLQATGSSGSTVRWYANSTGGISIGSGNTFTTPTINSTTTFYAGAETGSGSPSSATIGAGATTSATYSNPFYSLWSNTHMQHLILASELYAAGMSGGPITETGINITSAGTLPMIDLSVKMANTTATNLSAYVSPSFTTVYTSASLMPIVGINTLTFSTPFVWDGISNVVIEICHGNPSSTATMSRTCTMEATSYISSIHTHKTTSTGGSSQCTDNTTNVTTYSTRPQFYFTYVPVCSSPRTAVVATVTTPPSITVSSTFPAICTGGSTDLQVVSGNDPNYSYSWTSSPAGFSASGAGPHTVSPSVTTKYYVLATDNSAGANQGCAYLDSVTVIAGGTLAAGTITSDIQEHCGSGISVLTLTGASGGLLQWQKSTASSSGPWINVGTGNTVLSTGTITQTTYYQAVVSCQTNTLTSNVQTITVNNPQISSSSGATRCGPGVVTLTATPASGTINWYSSPAGGTALSSGNIYSPNVATTTTYYAAASFGGGLSSLGLPDRVGSTTNTGYSDVGLMFNATQAFTLQSVAIYPIATTPSGNVTVTIALKNSAGTVLQSATVAVPTAVSPGIKTTVPLNFLVPVGTGHRLVFTAASGGGLSGMIREITSGFTYPYTLSGIASITSAYTGGASASYYYYFYDWQIVTGCEGTRVPVVATVNPSPSVNVNVEHPTICTGQSATLTATSSNPNYSYTWNPGALTGASVNVTPTSNTTYTLSAIDISGGMYDQCTAIGTATVNKSTGLPPDLSTSGGGSACAGNPVTISVSNNAVGQGSGNTYSWSTDAVTPFTSTQQTPNVTGSSTTNNSGNYTVVVTNSFLCTASAVEVVTVNPNPTLSAVVTQNVGCVGGSDGIITATASNGTPVYNYTNDGFASQNNSGVFNNLPVGTQTITVQDDNGCSTTIISPALTAISSTPTTVAVTVPFTGMPTNVCNGTTATLSIAAVPNATMYIWDAPAGAYFNGVATNVSPFTTSTPSVTVTYGNPSGSLYTTGVQAANGCGASLRKVQKTRGLTSVPASVSGSLTACASTTGTYTTPVIPEASSYVWTVTGNATVSGTGTTATVTFGAGWTGGTLCVSSATSCYTSPAKCIAISNTATALSSLTGATTACPNTVLPYSVSASGGAATYAWTAPAGATIASGQGTPSVTVSYSAGYSAVGSICVNVTSICGITSANKCKTVAPGLPTQPSSITGSLSGLCNQTKIYSCPSQGGATTYNWTSPGSISSGQGSTSISTTFGTFTTGNVCVTASNTCGSSIARCVPVKGAPNTPGAITATPSSWCANTSGIEFDVNVSALTGIYSLNWAYPTSPVATYVLGGGNSTSLIMDWGTGSGAINVTASNACGNATKTSSWSSTCRQGEVGTVSTLTVSPNPTTGMININYTAQKGSTVINVLDLAGRVVMGQTVSSVDGSNNTQLDMSKLAKGAYMLSVQSTQGNKQVKVVVE